MCIYKRVFFKCNHAAWTGRVKQCTVGEDYQQRGIAHECMIKEGHPWHSWRLFKDCERCRLKKACEAFLANIRGYHEECSKVILSHPTNEGEKCAIKPMDGEDMEHEGNHDAESHQDSKPNSTTEVDQGSRETDNLDSEPDSATKVDHNTGETDSQDSEPDSTTQVDQDSRETDKQDGWIYSLNGRLQSYGKEVERDTESPSLPDTEKIEPRTLAEKDGSAVIPSHPLEPFRSCIPQQRKTDSQLPEALPKTKIPGTPSDTKIPISQKSNTASDKDRETARTTSALPILRAIPKPKPIDVAVDSHHSSPTPRLSIPIARKSSIAKVVRLPQPTRAMNSGLLKVPDRTLI
ncbi:unnamed protein product [Clonostachys byssicola]|uniref:Uncharacterized protein n=1 Tax=Clonostachys byssicola TaxID=160290 RepID=A0A9N9XTN8_9HYPO|nr:unnamed protein product [Clonostachys byssicola]